MRPPGAPPPDDPLPGTKLGDYVIEQAVGWGGMGIVYRAVHPLIGRSAAVKVLRPTFASDPAQTARFLQEAQAISAIKHRGIIDIIGFGALPDGRQYMMMEFLEGENLEAVMAREGPMTPARALALIDELLNALSAAHKVGVVHRDLKPGNVYLARETHGAPQVKLVDFGLARRAAIEDFARTGDKASLVAGTPEYLAPEQASGLAATPRTDLYSLGVMLFEMVTGQLPFTAPTLGELLAAHQTKAPPKPSALVGGLPPELEALILACLEKRPEQRPSADAARQVVQRVARQLKEQTTQMGPAPRRARDPAGPTDAPTDPALPARRRGGIAAAVALTVAVAGGVAWMRARPTPAPPPVVLEPPPPTVAATPLPSPPPVDPVPEVLTGATTPVTASTTITGGGRYAFKPAFVVDGDLTTCWQPASDPTGGVGAWVQVGLDGTPRVTAVEVANGFQVVDKLGDQFSLNNRLADGRLVFSDGTSLDIHFAPDAKGRVRFEVPPRASSSVRLEVVSIHRGAKWNDVAVSELAVFGTR